MIPKVINQNIGLLVKKKGNSVEVLICTYRIPASDKLTLRESLWANRTFDNN